MIWRREWSQSAYGSSVQALGIVRAGAWGRVSDDGGPALRLCVSDVIVASDLPCSAAASDSSLIPPRFIPVRLHVSCFASRAIPVHWAAQGLSLSLGPPTSAPPPPRGAALRPILLLPAATVRMGVAGDDALFLGKLGHEARWRWREWSRDADPAAAAAAARELSPSMLLLLTAPESLSVDASGLHVLLPRAAPLRIAIDAASTFAAAVLAGIKRRPLLAPPPIGGPEKFCVRRLPVPTALAGDADAPRDAPMLRQAEDPAPPPAMVALPASLPLPYQTLAVSITLRGLSVGAERPALDVWLGAMAPVFRRALAARAAAEVLLAAQVGAAEALEVAGGSAGAEAALYGEAEGGARTEREESAPAALQPHAPHRGRQASDSPSPDSDREDAPHEGHDHADARRRVRASTDAPPARNAHSVNFVSHHAVHRSSERIVGHVSHPTAHASADQASSSAGGAATAISAAYVALPWRARLPGAVAAFERELARRFIASARVALREALAQASELTAARSASLSEAMANPHCRAPLTAEASSASKALASTLTVARLSVARIAASLSVRSAKRTLARESYPPAIDLPTQGTAPLRVLKSIFLGGVAAEVEGVALEVPLHPPLLRLARLAVGAEAFVGLLEPPGDARVGDVRADPDLTSARESAPPELTAGKVAEGHSSIATAHSFYRTTSGRLPAVPLSLAYTSSFRFPASTPAPAQKPLPVSEPAATSAAPPPALESAAGLAILWLRAAVTLRVHGLHALADAHALPSLLDALVLGRGCKATPTAPEATSPRPKATRSSGAVVWACTPTVDTQVLLTDASCRLRAAEHPLPSSAPRRPHAQTAHRWGVSDASPAPPPSVLVSLRSLSVWANNSPLRHATNAVESTPAPGSTALPLPPQMPQKHLHVGSFSAAAG